MHSLLGTKYVTLSERDGWRHLYLVDKDDPHGEPCLLTNAPFDVIEISGIQEESKHVYFIASPGDPLRRYLYRVHFDGTDLRRITPEGNLYSVRVVATPRKGSAFCSRQKSHAT